MKRQSEELFFKYETTPIQIESGIAFELPSDYDPIPGDIIEMIVSEGGSIGGVCYYAHLVCYRYVSQEIYHSQIEALDGRLINSTDGFLTLDYSSYEKTEGKKLIKLYAPNGTTPFFDSTNHLVNLIVHRSKAVIDLISL